MKLNLTTKYKKKIELIILSILIIATCHHIKLLNEKIKENNHLALQINSKKIQLERTLSNQLHPQNLINEFKKITTKGFLKSIVNENDIYTFNIKIDSEALKKIVNIICNLNSNQSELIINNITNTVELIIPKSK